MQRQLFPVMYSTDATDNTNLMFASLNMAELLYTNRGIPIDEDAQWDYEGRYLPRISDPGEENGLFIPLTQKTASLNFKREPRFYASLGFDRGFFDIETAAKDGGATFSPYLKLRNGEEGYSMGRNFTGYYVKKLIAFETSCSQGDASKNYSGHDYRFPLIRLADLYLLYSEALNEVKGSPDAEVYEWIDKVRKNAGLQGVVASWQNSKYPNRPSDKKEMRKIIRQERMIELAFEGQRYWDIRRWKLGESLWTTVPKGWDNRGAEAEDYYTLINLAEPRKFTFRDYLWPINLADLRVNTNLVQTYGW
jgi:hypothetical protein